MPLVLLRLLLDVPTTSCTLRGPQRPRIPPSLPHHAEPLSSPPSPPRRHPANAAVVLPLPTQATWAPEDRARSASGGETPAPTFVARRAPCSLLRGGQESSGTGRTQREGERELVRFCAVTSRGLIHVSLQQRARDLDMRRAGAYATPAIFVDATHDVYWERTYFTQCRAWRGSRPTFSTNRCTTYVPGYSTKASSFLQCDEACSNLPQHETLYKILPWLSLDAPAK